MSLPSIQRAWVVVRKGKPSQALKLKDDHPLPQPKPGEVLVNVKAAALNPVGYKLMGLLPNFLAGRPLVAENDLAGVVVDSNGSEFASGDRVFGFIDVPIQQKSKQGSLAQFAAVPADNLARCPSNVTLTEAAGLSLVGQTAYQGLFEQGKLEEGQTVFINGGSSAVGALAIQLAKAKGCKVVASASAKNEEFVRSLGADEFVDYTQIPLHVQLSSNPPSTKYHLIFDTIGLIDPSLYKHSAAYLAPGGLYLSTGPSPSLSLKGITHMIQLSAAAYLPTWLGGMNRTFKVYFVESKKKDVEELKDLVEKGQLRPVVDSVYEFNDALKAYDKLLTHRARGKIVVKVDPDVD